MATSLERSGRTSPDYLAAALLATELGLNSRTGIGAMLHNGRIGLPELRAAERWLEDYALAELGVTNPAKRRGGSAQTPSGISDARLFAAEARRKAKQTLGVRLDDLLVAALAEGLDPAQIATGCSLDRRYIGGMLEVTLTMLSYHYANEDKSPRKH